MSHFRTVGLPVVEPADLSPVLDAVFATSGQEPRSGAHTLSWRDLSGGGLDVLVDPSHPDGGCVTPQFDGETRHTVRLRRVVEDPAGCPGCTTVAVDVLRDGELLYPLVLAPARAAVHTAGWRRELAASGESPERSAGITFVAEALERWADDEAFRAAQDADRDGELAAWGSRSVVPVGPFTANGPPQPYVVAHGHVVRAERRLSAAFDTPFWHVRLASYGGEYDVVAADEGVPAESPLSAGEVLRVRAWVCGRLDPPLGAPGEQEEEARWARFLAGSEAQSPDAPYPPPAVAAAVVTAPVDAGPVVLPTAADTRALGRSLADVLVAGDLVVLSGPLGAGKTVLAQGIGAGLDVAPPVTSPTFVLARVHRGGRLPLVHVDAYRLSSLAEVDDLDLDASLPDSVTVVEWGEGLVERLADAHLEVRLYLGASDRRTAVLAGSGGRRPQRLARLLPVRRTRRCGCR